MVTLLTVRVGYHMLVKINQITDFVEIEDMKVLSLALLIPYTTEVIFNLVIFYFNFMMPDSANVEDEEPQPRGPKTVTIGVLD